MADLAGGPVLRPHRIPAWFENETSLPSGERVAFVASFSPGPSVTPALHALIVELAQHGYPSVVIRASDDQESLIWPSPPPPGTVVMRKPNIGYDFGSWAVGLHHFEAELSREYVLLVNDSIVGPFASLAPTIENFEACTTDVWGATSTEQFHYHVQSFFLGFRGGVLGDRVLRRFWESLPNETEKIRIVMRYEIGLSRLLYAEGYSTSAMNEPEQLAQFGANPAITGWRALIERGFPFVKRELLREPELAEDGADIVPFVLSRYGVDLIAFDSPGAH